MSAFGETSAARSRARAEELTKQAEQTLKSFWGAISGNNRSEDAATLYVQAGHQHKAAKDLAAAGACYARAGELFQKAQQTGEAATAFSDAAGAWKSSAPLEAIGAARQAIEIYRGQGRFSQAGRLISQVGEMYEAAGEAEQAMENYHEAYEVFSAEGQPAKGNKWLQKEAELALAAEKYREAAAGFEALGDYNQTSNLLAQSAKNQYLMAFLAYCVMDSNLGRRKAEAFLQKDPHLQESRQGELMLAVCEAIEALDETAFTEAVGTYNRVANLSPTQVSLLLKIREPIEEAAADEPEAEEDVPDLDAVKIEAADDDVPFTEDGMPDLT